MSVNCLMSAFNHFSECSGLEANLEKSQLVMAGVSQPQTLLDITGFQLGQLPFKYLGFPIKSSRLMNTDCQSLIERITTRIRVWPAQKLTYAGKAQLINSVLLSMFTYWGQIFVLPKKVIDKVSQICRGFLWGSSPEHRKYIPVSWQTFCLSKPEGGLGFLDPHLWNVAALAKLLWDIALKKDCLWIRCVDHYYLKGASIWNYNPNSNSSWYWRKLLKARDKILPGVNTSGR